MNQKSVKVLGLSDSLRKAENFAKFGKPLERADLVFLAGNGLQDAAHRASSCMGWIWRQWLAGVAKEMLLERVGLFVDRGLQFREQSKSYDYLALHDLFLLHCAIFAASDARLKTVAKVVADASGDKGETPVDNGELYAAAWCGMMKYWILEDADKAQQQAAIIWGAQRDKGVLAAPKPLVVPWLKKDWSAFVKAQQKDFEKLWQRARKDGWTVRAETATEAVVTTDRYQIEHHWCWAHCGMAVLAHRQGVEVATDAFWFPLAAIAKATITPASGKENCEADQLRMF
jgi:hypothetical protein